ncbi:MAG: histidine kinase, partial [Bowdeniella nasicola]|nr:histidine kinase [Bowdeniella nasicola]
VSYTLGAEKKLRISLPTIFCSWVGLICVVPIFTDPADHNVWWGVLTLFIAVSFLIGSNVRSSRLRVHELEKRAHQIALEHQQREQLAVSQERTRIAREMHDVVAHSLSVMVTLAEGAAIALDRNPQMAKTAIGQLAEVGRESLQETRRLVGVLRDDTSEATNMPAEVPQIMQNGAPRDPQPGEKDVADLIASYQAAGIPVHFHESGPPLPTDAGLHLAIYRIVQEALTNVLRYARSSPRIEVSICRAGGEVVVTIENESGDGSSPLPGSGKGVIGMRERAAVFDGHVHAGPTTSGWQVRATLRIPGKPHTWTSPI